MIKIVMMMMLRMIKTKIIFLTPDCCPTGGAGAEHPAGEEDGGDVGQAQRDHQGPVLNIQGKVWKPQQAHQGSLLRTPDIYVIYSDENFQSDFKGRWQRRRPSSERLSRPSTKWS